MKMEENKRVRAEYRSSLRSKALIRKALLDLLEEKPFDKITITDIVTKADINRGTFYLHYKDISDVLEQIALSIVDELIVQLEKLDFNDVIMNPEIAFRVISEFLKKDFEFYKMLISLDQTGFALNEAILKGKDYVRRMQSSGEIELTGKPVLAMNYILAGSIHVYCEIINGGNSISLDEAPEYLGRIARSVIATLVL